jgi:hypothetical protein
MRKVFSIGVLLVFALVAACVYIYMNPRHAPSFLRQTLPGLEVPSPKSPMTNFRPPQWGPR